MASKRNIVVVGLTAFGLASAGLAAPALAGEHAVKVDSKRLDAASADYSYYRGHRRGWSGGRGAAIAGAVGLGVLGAAAIASSRPAYAEPYGAYDEGYAYYGPRRPVYYEPEPVYEAPIYAPRYQYYDGAPYYRGGYDSRYRSRNGTTDPSRGGR